MPDEDEVELVVAGQVHRGWQTASVRLSIEDIAGSFSVGFRDTWQDKGEPFPIREGDEVAVKIAGETVLTGYVDDFDGDYSKDGRKLRISGRSKTGDLVDCSAFLPPTTGASFAQLAEDICAPFGIKVRLTDPRVALEGVLRKPIERFAVQPGESCFEALTRLARMVGVLLVAGPDGHLEVVRAGASRVQDTVLRYGDNILSSSLHSGLGERFSQITVRGQQAGTDAWNGVQAATIVKTVDDLNVGRHRPLVLNADDAQGFEQIEKRALFERNSRAARSERLSVSLQGWRHTPQASGALVAVDASLGLKAPPGVWRPNYLVRVADPVWGIDGYMLIAVVSLSRDDAGRRTELELVPQGSYDVLATPERVAKKKKRPRKKGLLGGVSFNAVTGIPEPPQGPIGGG